MKITWIKQKATKRTSFSITKKDIFILVDIDNVSWIKAEDKYVEIDDKNDKSHFLNKALKQLEFVKHCRSLDISLNDIKRLIELKNKPEESCSSVNALIDQQLALVNKRMKELRALKAELQQMASACGSNNTIEACGIIKSLDS